jgi:hypothetical protein
MSSAPKDASHGVEALPQAGQENLARRRAEFRKYVDAKLARAEARGGATPHADVLLRLRCREAVTKLRSETRDE